MKINLPINVPLQLCRELLASMMLFQQQDDNNPIGSDFFTCVCEQFLILEQTAIKKHINNTIIQHMKYALAAFFDEMVLSSHWPYRTQWMIQPLQMEFFGEHLAGEGFFKQLQQLRQDPLANIDLLELFYVCLQFGFEGMYRFQGLEKLAALQVDLWAQIEAIRDFSDRRLVSDLPLINNTMKNIRWRLPFWVIGSATLAIIILIYSSFTIAINQQVASIASVFK